MSSDPATSLPDSAPFTHPDPFATADHEDGHNRDDPTETEGGRDAASYNEKSNDEDVAKPPENAPNYETKVTSTEKPKATITLPNESGDSTDERTADIKSKVKSAAHKFHLHSTKTSGFSNLFNPTSVRLHIKIKGDDEGHFKTSRYDGNGSRRESERESERESVRDSGKELALLWRSRDNRKGRNSIAVPVERTDSADSWLQSLLHYRPRSTSTSKEVARILWTMFTTFPYWDMAFWSGWSYTIGSALFVIDGAFSWGPQAFPGTEFKGEAKWGVPLCFFFGAVFYQIGAVMAYLEAVNDGSFHGSAMRRLVDANDEDNKELLDEKLHSFFSHLIPHSHKRKEKDVEALEKRRISMARGPRRGGIDLGGDEGEFSPYMSWRWWPTWQVLRTHHRYEIGFVACTIQLFGVTLYGITAIVVLPGILDTLNTWQTNAAYWIPQMVAAACFLIASIMFTLETQDKWYRPEPKLIGWWIGIWSTIGSVGFELSAGFGPAGANSTGYKYQSSLSSMWGSAAYLIGSFLQWYEAVNKEPVEEMTLIGAIPDQEKA